MLRDASRHCWLPILFVFVLIAGICASPAVSGAQTPRPTTTPSPGQPSPRPGQPPRDPAPSTQRGTAVIRGRVVAFDTGLPLRRVRIMATGGSTAADAGQSRSTPGAFTDENGVYEIKALRAGRYTLLANKAGYVSLQYGQRRPLETGRPIELANGQVMEKVDFHLPRGAVITGRIVDEAGEPLPDVNVLAMQQRHMNGRRRMMPAGRSGTTNDIGVFRIYGLQPGDYYLSANARGGMLMMMGDSDQSSGYAPTYYPGTPSASDAQKVTVGVSAEASADFQLVPTRLARLSGIVVDSRGRPLTSGNVMMQSLEGLFTASGGGSRIRPDGSFTIDNVAPGSYYLTIGSNGAGVDAPFEAAFLPITVAGENIDTISLTTSPGAGIRGRVIYDGSEPPANPSAVSLSCSSLNPEDGPAFLDNASGTADARGQFELKGVRRPCVVRPTDTPAGWSLKAVLQGGADVTDRELDVASGKPIAGVEVILTNRVTTLSGSVAGAQNQPVKDYVVIAFAEDKDRWAPMTRHIRSARPDQEGQFKIVGLPVGKYLVAAVESLEPGSETDPEVLERLRAQAEPARLDEGGSQTVALKLSALPAP